MAIRSPRWLALAALVYATPDTPGVYEEFVAEHFHLPKLNT